MPGRARKLLIVFLSAPQATLRTLLLVVAGPFLLTACPPKPVCPNCSIKRGKYTIPAESELPDGYTITAAKLEHDVDYDSHCPDPPSGDTPPCNRNDTKSVMPAEPEKSYTKRLIFPTDAAQDSESAVVHLTLSKPGKPDITEDVSVTVLP